MSDIIVTHDEKAIDEVNAICDKLCKFLEKMDVPITYSLSALSLVMSEGAIQAGMERASFMDLVSGNFDIAQARWRAEMQ